MTSITRDPLLATAKGILWFLMGTMLIATVACLVAIPTMHIFQHDIMVALTKEAPKLSMPQFLWVITAILACTVVLLLILFRVFQLLKRIVDTVGEGDPFVPDNATRLTQMAWLSLGVQIASMVIGIVATWLEGVAGDASDHGIHIEIYDGISGNGLLLMLILFILARVFRQGAAMRAELEGTV
jgi:hypothetical protein